MVVHVCPLCPALCTLACSTWGAGSTSGVSGGEIIHPLVLGLLEVPFVEATGPAVLEFELRLLCPCGWSCGVDGGLMA